MLAAVLIIVLALAVIALVLFVALLAGMRNEPTHDRLSTRAPSPLATLTRRALGVSVRTSVTMQAADDTHTPREPWFAGAGYTPANRDDGDR
jgi:NADH:ubiquinone oxidoreductase subunit 6 (subunit J)